MGAGKRPVGGFTTGGNNDALKAMVRAPLRSPRWPPRQHHSPLHSPFRLGCVGARRTVPSRLASPWFPTSLVFLPHLPGRPPAVLHRHDTKGVLQNNPHSQPGAHRISLPTTAEELRTAPRAYPKADAENPGMNPKLVDPPPPPFIIPEAVCHYAPSPCRLRSLRFAVPGTCQSLALHLPLIQY
ncbi:PREDICTED: dual specificity protein kinase lkh1-like [Hipposideros armiger]|uniref:Dual specificity protein kinase lkh1-like n=1 Tax=Hipposideros armiger TaxID=186990 RepID=A0A8B7RPL7_HIPAR|nr:PREDICTED: dual specificity protein kinase lkh1-like [Hipposideros armiger]